MIIEDLRRPNGNYSNSGERLYHKDIGFPDDIDMPHGFTPVMNLSYSNHAKEEAKKDIYGDIGLPHRIDVRKGQTIEIGVTGKTVTKLVVRFSYNDTHDITMVIMTDRNFVKTVWLNDKGDQHAGLNKAKYYDPARPNYAPQGDSRPTLTQQQYRDRHADLNDPNVRVHHVGRPSRY